MSAPTPSVVDADAAFAGDGAGWEVVKVYRDAASAAQKGATSGRGLMRCARTPHGGSSIFAFEAATEQPEPAVLRFIGERFSRSRTSILEGCCGLHVTYHLVDQD
jgi:hypothetical protein